MPEMITISKSRLNNIIKAGIQAGVQATVAELTSAQQGQQGNQGQTQAAKPQGNQASNQGAQGAPVKRGPGRPRKDAQQGQNGGQQAAQGQQAQPIKRGPGRPKKDQSNAAPASNNNAPQNRTVKSNNTANNANGAVSEAKPRGRVPVAAPLMLEAMKAIFNRNGNRDVTFEDLRAELKNRENDKKSPIQPIAESTMRNYLTTMEGKLWDRSAPGKYIPNFRAA